jgi:hypothetical protein
LIEKSSRVDASFNKKIFSCLVAVVGLIVVALSPEPLTVTPAGTVKGQVSSNIPALTLITSPLVATLNACAIVRNGLLILSPSFELLPVSAT